MQMWIRRSRLSPRSDHSVSTLGRNGVGRVRTAGLRIRKLVADRAQCNFAGAQPDVNPERRSLQALDAVLIGAEQACRYGGRLSEHNLSERVVRPLDPGRLDQAAVHAVSQRRFEPGRVADVLAALARRPRL